MKDAELHFFNTLTRTTDVFTPRAGTTVRMYNCGPTVYGRSTIGNLRSYVFADLIRRTLEYSGYTVAQVINITDVGHLTSDADEGEDKMTLGLQREGMELTLENMRALGERYAQSFFHDLAALNIETTDTQFPRASDYIDAQIALIKTLEEKGYAYTTSDGVYFEVARFPNYGALGGIAASDQQSGARVSVNEEKRDPRDFALWKLNADLGWDSPWGTGFPGWHIECSSMILSTLGKQIDIHTGGIDHISIHHNNEIAQSEAATGKSPLARFWLHNAFITIEGRRIGKSVGNMVYLDQLVDRGYAPLAYRYWLLTAHYATPANFTWGALAGAHTSLKRLHRYFVDVLGVTRTDAAPDAVYTKRFAAAIRDNLDTPKALSLLWELVKDESIEPAVTRATILDMDRVLGLGFAQSHDTLAQLRAGDGTHLAISDTPDAVQALVRQREDARAAGDYAHADTLREEITAHGFHVDDTSNGPQLSRL